MSTMLEIYNQKYKDPEERLKERFTKLFSFFKDDFFAYDYVQKSGLFNRLFKVKQKVKIDPIIDISINGISIMTNSSMMATIKVCFDTSKSYKYFSFCFSIDDYTDEQILIREEKRIMNVYKEFKDYIKKGKI